MHRDRHRPPHDDTAPAALEDAFRETAELLATAAHTAATHTNPDEITARIPALAALLDALTATAVAHDRARGDSWPVIAARLGLEPETARRRHRHRCQTTTPASTQALRGTAA